MSIEAFELIHQSLKRPLETSVDLLPNVKLFSQGKVREMYDVGEGQLLAVTLDRISAFDVVMADLIPMKGAILNQISTAWFKRLKRIVPNHFISAEQIDFPEPFNQIPELAGRSMLVKKADRLDFECVARGYLAGSAWAEYKNQGTILGEFYRPGLPESAKLPETIYTPATKAETGHDENIPFAATVEIARNQFGNKDGLKFAMEAEQYTLNLYKLASKTARQKGLILADTKFEFGVIDGKIILIDEALTPDSSRYWPVDGYQPGQPQPSFDKQYLRDYLESINWNKQPPPPQLPQKVIVETQKKYLEAFTRLQV